MPERFVVDGMDTPAMFRPSNTPFDFRCTLTWGLVDFAVHLAAAGMKRRLVSGHFTLDQHNNTIRPPGSGH